jgi:hypothetical protein
MVRLSAHEKIRTSTPERAPPPQSGVSTSFTTCAIRVCKSRKSVYLKQQVPKLFFTFFYFICLDIFFSVAIWNSRDNHPPVCEVFSWAFHPKTFFSADWRVLYSKAAMVIGPTPPGTGVIAEAIGATSSNFTSPMSLNPDFLVASSIL